MEKEQRIGGHPIVVIGRRDDVSFYWDEQRLTAKKGEMISSALFAAGIKVFGEHHRDKGPMGIFCANGQCSQCTVIANGIPVKACVTEVSENMQVKPCRGLPVLVDIHEKHSQHVGAFKPVPVIKTQVAILGGGPAGLKAAAELARLNIRSLIIDDKVSLGGKLVLQTHTFFGSVEDCYAGSRGIDIAIKLENEVRSHPQVKVMSSTQVVAVFSDNRVGVVQDGQYSLVEPEVLLVATGAREKALSFAGCDLPGVYGGGAFQTLVNRDLIRAGKKILIVGGGNVGLIAGYHALQAGMTVTALIEAMPKVSGYRVHKDKLARLGVPILLSHTILAAHANADKTGVVSATIAQVDSKFAVLPGTEQTVECDTILVAAGLSSCDEFYRQAKAFGLKVFMAGDAEEIAEASAAMFSGKIAAVKIANALGMSLEVPTEYLKKMAVLKSKPGKNVERQKIDTSELRVYPSFHCVEEIPCNPCTSACSKKFIQLQGDTKSMMDLPYFLPEPGEECSGCMRCAALCPGLAITIIDKRKAPAGMAHVSIPFEMIPNFKIGDNIQVLDRDGAFVSKAQVVDIIDKKWQDKTLLIKVLVSQEEADRVAGIRFQEAGLGFPKASSVSVSKADNIVCRCEKVTDGEIRAQLRTLLQGGIMDMNALKGIRCTMGACGGKTCTPMVKRLFSEVGAELGVDVKAVTDSVLRPLSAEIGLGSFANQETEKEPNYESDL